MALRHGGDPVGVPRPTAGRPLRIALVCNEYPPRPHGGIGSFVRDYAEGLAARGHDVLVAGWGPEPGTRRDGPIRVVTVPESRVPGLHRHLNRLRLTRLLAAEVAAGRVELVETPDFDGPLPWGVGGAPVVARLHLARTLVERHAGRVASRNTVSVERRTLARADAWIGVSRHVVELTERGFGVHPPLATAVLNFVGPSDPSWTAPPLPRPYLLFVGTVSERKGALVVARAARELMETRPELSLVYVGDALRVNGRPAVDAIRELLGPVADRAVFTGRLPREQARAAMRGAAAFVFPSLYESSSLVTLEAMTEGCPVVVPCEPPFTEFVRDGHTGLLVPPEDPAAIARALVPLVDGDETRERLAASARRFVREELTADRNVAESIAFYATVLARRAEVLAG